MSVVQRKPCKVGGKGSEVPLGALTRRSTSGACRKCKVCKTREAPGDFVSKRAPDLFTMPHYLSAQQEGALLGPDQVPGEGQGDRAWGWE